MNEFTVTVLLCGLGVLFITLIVGLVLQVN